MLMLAHIEGFILGGTDKPNMDPSLHLTDSSQLLGSRVQTDPQYCRLHHLTITLSLILTLILTNTNCYEQIHCVSNILSKINYSEY